MKEKFEVQETKIKTMAKLVSLIQELVDSKWSSELMQNSKQNSYADDKESYAEYFK